MKVLIRLLNQQVSCESVDGWVAQIVCYLAGVGVMILGFWKLTRLSVTEVELFLGALLVLLVAVVMIAIGLLMHLIHLVKNRNSGNGV